MKALMFYIGFQIAMAAIPQQSPKKICAVDKINYLIHKMDSINGDIDSTYIMMLDTIPQR